MLSFMIQHELASGIVGYFLLQSAVTALPTPQQGASQAYHFLFDFSHNLTANLGRIRAFRNIVDTAEVQPTVTK